MQTVRVCHRRARLLCTPMGCQPHRWHFAAWGCCVGVRSVVTQTHSVSLADTMWFTGAFTKIFMYFWHSGPYPTTSIHWAHAAAPMMNKPWDFAQQKVLERHRCRTRVLHAMYWYKTQNQGKVCSAFSILSAFFISCCHAIPRQIQKKQLPQPQKNEIIPKAPLSSHIYCDRQC